MFELKQAMGGGKTHSMIALGLLAQDSTLRAQVVPEIAAAAGFGDAQIVAVNGRVGFEETFLWGEIARQLGKAAEFSKFWRNGVKAPPETDWIALIGEEPTLSSSRTAALLRLRGHSHRRQWQPRPGHYLRSIESPLRIPQTQALLHCHLQFVRQL